MTWSTKAWLALAIALVGFSLGYHLLPMRWWRHGELPTVVPLTFSMSVALSIASARWPGLGVPAAVSWVLSTVALARVLVWIATWNPHVGAGVAWGLTVIAELTLLASRPRARRPHAEVACSASWPGPRR